MASSGLMIGLGQGITSAGQMVGQHYANKSKEEFEAKLEEAREKRREEAKIREENRQRVLLDTTPDPKQSRFVTKEGALFEQRRSSTGNVLEERLANEADIDAYNAQKQKEKLGLEADLLDMEKSRADAEYKRALISNAGLQGQLSQKKVDSFDTEQALENQERIARADASRARASGSNSAASSATPSEYAQALIDESPGIVAQYAEGDDPDLTKAELKTISLEVIKESVARGQSPDSQTLQRAVKAFMESSYYKNKKKKSGASSGAVMPVTLTR